jgi:hypothetical protein
MQAQWRKPPTPDPDFREVDEGFSELGLQNGEADYPTALIDVSLDPDVARGHDVDISFMWHGPPADQFYPVGGRREASSPRDGNVHRDPVHHSISGTRVGQGLEQAPSLYFDPHR